MQTDPQTPATASRSAPPHGSAILAGRCIRPGSASASGYPLLAERAIGPNQIVEYVHARTYVCGLTVRAIAAGECVGSGGACSWPQWEVAAVEPVIAVYPEGCASKWCETWEGEPRYVRVLPNAEVSHGSKNL